MPGRSSATRRRQITSCTECYRRKQKCDRAKPCNICVNRKVPGKCAYSSAVRTDLSSLPQVSRPSIANPQVPVEGETPAATSRRQLLSDQAGYLSIGDSAPSLGDRGSQDSGPAQLRSLPSSMKDKFRDLASQLPPPFLARELVDGYFSEANWYFGVLEQHYFEKLYTSWRTFGDLGFKDGKVEELPQDVFHFPALLFQTLAVALQFLPPNTLTTRVFQVENSSDRDRLSQMYGEKGMEIMTLLGREDPTITAVQHDLMRGVWLKNCSRGKEAWHVLGSAVRMAQELGLHLHSEVYQTRDSKVEDTLNQLWYEEYKRRLWIRLFAWDSHMAFTLNRPRIIHLSDCTAKPPLDCDLPFDPSVAVPTVVGEHDPPSSFTPHLFQYSLSRLVHEAMSLNANKRDVKDYSVVKKIHGEVLSLLDNLPAVVRHENPNVSWDNRCSHLAKQREQIATSANSFLLALYRAHARDRRESRQAAVQAALSILASQERLFNMMGKHAYNLYILTIYSLDASIFLSVTLAEHPLTDIDLTSQVHRAIRAALYRLQLAMERSQLARSGERILKLCYQKMERSTPFEPTSGEQGIFAGQSNPPNPLLTDITVSQLHSSPEQSIFRLPVLNGSELDQLNSSIMFTNVTEANFDMTLWIQQMGYWENPAQGSGTGQDSAFDPPFE
ncbi:hypothetical protein B7463_g9134, partial [Scytalidium lignicola]